MSDPSIPALDDDVRSLVERTAKPPGAPIDAKMRIRARLDVLVGPTGGAGGGAGGQASASVLASPSGRGSGLSRRWLSLAASFALGGGIVAVVMRAFPPPPAESRIVYVERPGATRPVEEPAAESAEPNVGSPSLVRPAPNVSASPSSPNQFGAERALLDLARSALGRGEPEAALDAAIRHERAYPNGIFVQEREAIAIRSLVLLGRTSEARVRANRFRLRFPESVLLPTVQSIAGSSSDP